MGALVFDGDGALGAQQADTAGLDACVRRTFGPRVIPSPFGPAALRLNPGGVFGRPLRDPVLVPSAHMAGGWLRPALEAGQGRLAGAVLVAACVNDLVCRGASPLCFMISARAGGAPPGAIVDLADGAAEACRAADCAFAGADALVQDEGPGQSAAAGYAAGVVERPRLIDSHASASPGDAILGVASGGLCEAERCAVERLAPGAWAAGEPLADTGCALCQALAAPPRVLARPMAAVFGAYRRKRVPTGAVCVGEGGVPGALLRGLPSCAGARVRLGAWPRPPVFTALQRMAGLDLEAALRVFGMGLGLLVFAPAYFAAAMVRKLARQGVEAWVIGEVTDGEGRVEVE